MRISDWSSGRVLFRSGGQRRQVGSGRVAEPAEGAVHLRQRAGGTPRDQRFDRFGQEDEGKRDHHRCGDRAEQEHRRSEEHTSELQSLMRISYAVFCLKKKKTTKTY